MISLSTIVGILGAFTIFIYAIFKSTDNYLLFVSAFSFLIVLGGTLGGTLISYSFRLILAALSEMLLNLLHQKNQNRQLRQLITRVLEWNTIYRTQGISMLENSLSKSEKNYNFLLIAMELIGTGYKSDELANMLHDTNAVEGYERGPWPA